MKFISKAKNSIGIGTHLLYILLFSFTAYVFISFGFQNISIAGIIALLMGVPLFILYIRYLFKTKDSIPIIGIDNQHLVFENLKIPLQKIYLDIYNDQNGFFRYHLWDENKNLTIYSVDKDDLVVNIQAFPIQVNSFNEISSTTDDSYLIGVHCSDDYKMFYNLQTGAYKFINRQNIPFENEKFIEPQHFIVDPEYILEYSPDDTSSSKIRTKSSLQILGEKVYREKMDHLNKMIIRERKKLSKGEKKKEFLMLINELCLEKEDANYLLKSYEDIYNKDLIEEINNLSNKYSTIQEFCNVFIVHGLVSERYPHERVEVFN